MNAFIHYNEAQGSIMTNSSLHYIGKLKQRPYLFIGDAGPKGMGVFAAKTFRCGEIISIDDDNDYYNNVLSYEQIINQGYDVHYHAFQVDHDAYVLPVGSVDDFMNHSCEPNCGIRLNSQGYLNIALRDIAVGEEICYDYSTYMNGPYQSMPCACNAASCRGAIAHFPDLPKDTRRYYQKWDVVGAFACAHNHGSEVIRDCFSAYNPRKEKHQSSVSKLNTSLCQAPSPHS